MIQYIKSLILQRVSFNHKIRAYLSKVPSLAKHKNEFRTGSCLPDSCLVLTLNKGNIYKHSKFNSHSGSNHSNKKVPLVSALMLTNDRTELAKRAIECFMAQSYDNKELIIVEDGDDIIHSYLKHEGLLSSPQVKYWHNAVPNKLKSLGALRNQSLRMANGDYICVWDDDDLFHPDRISHQMAACLEQDAGACFLLRLMLFSDDLSRHLSKINLAISDYRLWEGSIIVKNNYMPKYPNWMKHEDSLATYRLTASRKIVALDLPELYIYNFHVANTWHLKHKQHIWNNATKSFSLPDELYSKLRSMRQGYPHLKILATNLSG